MNAPERFEGAPVLSRNDFNSPALGVIYTTLRSLAAVSTDVSPSELYRELDANEDAKRVGDLEILNDLYAEGPVAWNASRLACTILLASRKREQKLILERAITTESNGGLSTEGLDRLRVLSQQIGEYEQGILSKPKTGFPEFVFRSYEEIERRPVHWLWPRYIPLGMLTILEGESGIGKSTLLLDIAARLSNGRAMPDNSVGRVREGKTTILSIEDPRHEVMRPKLDRIGAKLANVRDAEFHQPGCEDFAEVFLSSPETLEALERAIAREGLTLLMIDPLFGFVGDVKTGVDADMRARVLGPLVQIAERTRCAIVCVRHTTKDLNRSVKHKGGGSVAIYAVARSVLYVEKHPEEEDAYVLASSKMSLLKQPPSLGYRICGDDPLQPDMWIEWTGQVQFSADELAEAAAASHRTTAPTKQEQIADWLSNRLGTGDRVSVSEIRDALDREFGKPGDSTLKRARERAGIQTARDAQFQGGGVWFIPQGDHGDVF